VAKQWTYGDAWEHFPIEAGEIWGLPNGSAVAVHNIFNPLPAFMLRADMLFVDPPWNQGNINSFYTKAGRTDRVADFGEFERVLFQRVSEIAPAVCYLEVGFQAVESWEAALGLQYPCVQRWNVTYYRKHPCHILRGGPTPTLRDYNGMDEEKVIAAIGRGEQYNVMGDLCMGRGLVGLSAYAAGKPFMGTELNPRRLAVLLDRLAKRGADVQRLENS